MSRILLLARKHFCQNIRSGHPANSHLWWSMKLLERLSAACRTMNFAKSTEACDSAWVEVYLRFHRQQEGKWVHPDPLREPAVERFLTDLAVRRKLAASSQSQALCALVFFYREVLGVPLGRLLAIRAKRPERLPTILSADEVRRILAILDGARVAQTFGCEYDDDLYARVATRSLWRRESDRPTVIFCAHPRDFPKSKNPRRCDVTRNSRRARSDAKRSRLDAKVSRLDAKRSHSVDFRSHSVDF